MRKILITLILFGAIINSKSELQHFFPDSNACFSVSWMKFWFEGDTIIENLKYKKVYWQWNDSIPDFSKAQYFAAIREDTIAEKVYCVPTNLYNPQHGTDEYLLYDFAVEVGETVNFYTFWPDMWYLREESNIVVSIDSILVDGDYRKRINFRNYNNKDYWIEGIGSINGIFFPGLFLIQDVMDWTFLLCVHIDNRLIYQSTDIIFNNCYIPYIGTGIDDKKNYPLKIYPTIADDFLYFETDNINDFDYKIFNIQGQIIKDGILDSDNINVSDLNKGFYLVLILDNKKNIYRQKFVKR
ncbi:MAG: T9SS type A sorting domain-containing protein [Marinilabiliaceae bacterium]|nr:T9SS type A sorting domain-containing protein [Marinilabiliaceae bacterium]